MMQPTLQTERLTLRPMVAGDFPAYAAAMASSRAAGMGGPFDARAAWGMFCHDIACWHLFGHGALMVETRPAGQTVGQVGLNGGPLFPEPELGWMLFEGYEGQGFATEAAGALRDWAFENRPLETLVSYTDPDNLSSIRVAQRLGAQLDPDAPRQDPSDLVWRHARRMQ